MGQGHPDATRLTPPRAWPLVVRRARPADEHAVLAFATRTWNDWDYMPHAWPRWLEERDGLLLVGTVGQAADGAPAVDAEGKELEVGQPVAVVRVAMPARREAWLEGIRVDPRVRGMDVATDLQVAELHWAEAQGADVVRYATSSRNEGSLRLGARGGFKRLVELRNSWWSATGSTDEPRPASGFLPEIQAQARERRRALLAACAAAGLIAPAARATDLFDQLATDASFVAGARLYEPRPWALEELSQPKFVEHLERGEVVTVPRDKGRFALAILVADVPPAEDPALRLAVLAGDPGTAFGLVETMRQLAGASIRFRFADDGPLVEAVRERYVEAGYVFPEFALHIVARPLDAAHRALPIDPARVVLEDPPAATIVAPRP